MPVLRVVFTHRAARQIGTAADWWRVNRMDAPEAVRDELVKAVGLIASQPTCGSPIASRRFRGLRRVHLARIDYHVYYRLAPRLRQVEILAFWHARRGSSPHL